MNIYLDNASTTFPKPQVVADSIYNYITNIGGNANRSGSSNSLLPQGCCFFISTISPKSKLSIIIFPSKYLFIY